jgi:hypothetical protein
MLIASNANRRKFAATVHDLQGVAGIAGQASHLYATGRAAITTIQKAHHATTIPRQVLVADLASFQAPTRRRSIGQLIPSPRDRDSQLCLPDAAVF